RSGGDLKRILIVVLVALLLVGCGRSVTEDFNFDEELKTLEEQTLHFATGGGDIEEFRGFIVDFNDKLSEIDSDDVRINKFTELQRKANEIRLEGFSKMDSDKINESTTYKAEALEIYYEIKEGAN